MEETQKISNKEVKKRIYSMILPITIENILQMTAGMISMSMIGRLDAVSIGALGISTRITQIIWALFKGITTGASVFVSQAYGANNVKKVRKVIQQTLISSMVLVLILQQLIFWNAGSLLKIFSPEPSMLNAGIIYMKTISIGLPFMVIMLIVDGVLQGMGNAKTPMRIAITMNLANILFSFIFIFGKFGVSPLGLKGAAIGTVIAQVISASIGLFVLFRKDGVLNSLLNKKFFELDNKQIKDIYKVGFPSSLETMFWQFAAIILTKVMLTFGETAFAAYQLGLQAESISYMPALGFSIAATAFTGQTLGAKNPELGRRYVKEALKGSIMFTMVSALILILLPKQVMGLLTNNKDIISLGAKYLILMGLVQVPQNISGVLYGSLRGAGYTKIPMIIAAVGLWGVRIPFSLLLTYYFKLNIIAIWIVMCADLIVRFILSTVLYKTKNIFEKNSVCID